MKAARFSYTIDAESMTIVIVDRDGDLSVTNDADAVIETFQRSGIPVDDYTIVYRDTEHRWVGLRTFCGVFSGFEVIGAEDPVSAIREMISRRSTMNG